MNRIEYDNVTVPVIVQFVGGDLRLRGRSGGRLQIDGEGAEAEQLGEGQPYVVRISGDARITVPDDVNVSVQQVSGDAKLTELGCSTDVNTVGGDLIVRGAQSVNIKTVGSDLRVKRVEGEVIVESVGSDATIREVTGNVWVAAIGSDLYLRNIDGSCKVDRVSADLVLNISFAPEQEYHFNIGGDILCRVREETNATFYLPAKTECRLDVEVEISESDDGQQIVTLGTGEATVTLGEANSLRLVGEEEDYVLSFGVQIEDELEARLTTLETKLSRQLEGLDERIQAKAQHWSAQAEQIAERAQQQAERAAERVRRKMERSAKRKRDPGPRRIQFALGSDGTPKRKKDPVTEQERLLILQMVQENKITIEEAERLLAALEG